MPGFESASAPAASKGGGGLFGTGFSLPNIGLGEFVHGVYGSLNGLYHAGLGAMHGFADLATGNPAGQDFVPAAAIGKGVTSSFLGTLLNAGDLVTGGLEHAKFDSVRDAIGTALDHNNPTAYAPQTLMEEYNQGGIINPVVTNLGNIAAGAGVLGKLATVGDVGTLGEAAATASRATAAGFTGEDIANAAEAAKNGAQGFRDAGIENRGPLADAGKAAAAAQDVSPGAATPEQVAGRARWINIAHSVAHPYTSLFQEVLSPLGRAATASLEDATKTVGEQAVIQDALTGAQGGAEGEMVTNPGIETPETPTQVPGTPAPVSDHPGDPTGPSAPKPDGTPGVYPISDELKDAQANLSSSQQQTPEEAVAEATKVGQAAQDAKLKEAGVKPGDGVTMYQGRQGAFNPAVGTAGGVASGETPFWSDTLKEAQTHAGPGGHVVQVEVSKAVAADARKAGLNSGDFGAAGQGSHIVDPEWTKNAIPTDYAGAAAHEIGGAEAAATVAGKLHGPSAPVPGETPLKTTPEPPHPTATIVEALKRPAIAQPEVTSLHDALESAVTEHMNANEPGSVLNLTKVGPEGGPVEQAIRRAAQAPIQQWAKTAVSHLPPSAVHALSTSDRFYKARQGGMVFRERQRLQDINRREIKMSPAFAVPRRAISEEIVGKALPDGTIITSKMADGLAGDAIIAHLQHVSAVEDAVVKGATPTVMNQVRQALVRAGERSAQSLPDEWLHDAAGNRTSLGNVIDNAVGAIRTAASERTDILHGTSEKGLEHVADSLPGLSPKSQRAMRAMADDMKEIRRLEASKIPAERELARAKFEAMGNEAGKIHIELVAAHAARKAAEDELDATRLPKNASEEYKAGESPGVLKAKGITPVNTHLGTEEQGQLTPGQRLRSLPDTAASTRFADYEAGLKGAQAAQRIQDAVRQEAELAARKQALLKNMDDLKSTLLEHQLDSEQVRDRLAGRVQQSAERVGREMASPRMAQVPAQWMPVWDSITALHREAETNPALAQALTDGHITQNWATVLRIAAEQGFDPVHVRSFSDAEVKHLVYDSVQLGKKGRDLGQNIVAGTRNERSQAATRTRSLSALEAGIIEATHEMHTNALANFMHDTFARPVVNGTLMPGHVGWDAERSFLLTGEKDNLGTTVVKGLGAPQWQVPREVISVLHSYEKDFNSPIWNSFRKAAQPWKLLMLTLHPTWYINHIMGHIVLAAKEGVGLGDWLKAISAFKDGRFEGQGLTGALTGGLESEFPGAHSAIASPKGVIPAIKDAFRIGKSESRTGIMESKFAGTAGGVAAARDVIASKLARPATVVDEISRVATYMHGVRKGMTDAQALERTYHALVDFTDMNPWEREVAKSLIPFYSFQKGMFKIVGRMPLDHPAVTAVMLQIGKVQQQLMEDQFGAGLPQSEADKIKVPGLGWINPKMVNPFMDAKTLTSPQEIFNTLNPLLKIGATNAAAPYVPTYHGAPTEVNPYGTVVPTTSPGNDLAAMIGGLPQVKAVAGLAGANAPGAYVPPGQGPPSIADTLAGFALPSGKTDQELLAKALKGANGGTTPKAKSFKSVKVK